MTRQREIEIFSAGCRICQDTIRLVEELACPSCRVTVLDMNDAAVAERAAELGIRAVPAVVIDGTLASCCAGAGPDRVALQAAGIGQPLS